jgi:hypothetical protein
MLVVAGCGYWSQAMNESPETIRLRAERIVELAHSVTNEAAKADLLRYAQELIDQAAALETPGLELHPTEKK